MDISSNFVAFPKYMNFEWEVVDPMIGYSYFIIFNAKILVILVESADVTVTNVSIGDASTARNTYEENYPDSESIHTFPFFSPNKMSKVSQILIHVEWVNAIKYEDEKWLLSKGTIHPGLRLVPSGNFFLALDRSHHFLFKKVRIW